MRLRLAAAAAVLAGASLAAVALAGTSGAAGPPRVVARDDAGRIVASLPLAGDRTFALAYRHSSERAAAEERFRATEAGGFELRSIRSPDAGVLDYYEADGRRGRDGGRWVLTLATPVAFETLRLAASAHGRRTLVAGDRSVALHPRGGTTHVRVRVEER